MKLAFENAVRPAAGYPIAPQNGTSGSRLNISVVFTSDEGTASALRRADALARSLGAQITLLVLQLVPYPRALDDSPIVLDWNEERLRNIADQVPAETAVHIYLCRDRLQTLKSVLRSGTIVVIGCRRKLWPTSEVRLAGKLRELGHAVILTEAE